MIDEQELERQRLRAWAAAVHTALEGQCESTISLNGSIASIVGRYEGMEVEVSVDTATTTPSHVVVLVLAELEATAAPG